MDFISIQHAREGNLQDISVQIPKNRLVVFTGLSGSGKSTLLVDVLFQECQRQYLEAMGLQGIRKPQVERVQGASPAVLISQTDQNKNPRSTVGTLTDLYTDLRMIYEKLGVRRCPACGGLISAADCREDTEKIEGEFHVYMTCCLCGHRMAKLTRTEFSFNTREGACPTCEGLGQVLTVDRSRAVDAALSLEEGAVAFWEGRYAEYETGLFYKALGHYGLPVPKGQPAGELSDLQRSILMEGAVCPAMQAAFPHLPPPKTASAGRFEGVVPMLLKRLAQRGGEPGALAPYFCSLPCPDCGGERLNRESRAVTVNGTRLPALGALPLKKLSQWVEQLEASLSEKARAMTGDYLLDLHTKLARLSGVGLDYLTLDRQTITLSGGELQRLRLAAVLASELTGVIYILDEPTAGLHPRDTAGMIDALKALRDLGNTVLVIEHDPEVMQAADHMVDIGPGAGRQGGRVMGQGTLAQILCSRGSATGGWLSAPHPVKTAFRSAGPGIQVRGAHKFNLKGFDVMIPAGCLTAVTGPSGSGKSTLIFELVAKGDGSWEGGTVSGCSRFARIAEIGQAPLTRMKRSNVATYSEVYTTLRKLFAACPEAKQKGLSPGHFSFNSAGGRCENCEGLGYVTSNLLFFQDQKVVCPLCGGRQFQEEILSVKYKGRSIHEMLQLSVEEAAALLADQRAAARPLGLLMEVGLGYLTLGQPLTTLSAGEAQRLKLAKELIVKGAADTLYLLDEPTLGLHPQDIAHFLLLLNKLVDAGGTVVVVEHDRQIIQNSDWVIDLGPGGGEEGGELIFTGTPAQLLDRRSVTAQFLSKGAKNERSVGLAPRDPGQYLGGAAKNKRNHQKRSAF